MRALMFNEAEEILWEIEVPDSTSYPLQAVLALAEDDDVEMSEVAYVALVHELHQSVRPNPQGPAPLWAPCQVPADVRTHPQGLPRRRGAVGDR